MHRLARQAFLLLCFLICAGRAQASDIAVLVSEEGGAYGEFTTALQNGLEGSPWRIRWVGTPATAAPLPKTDLLVTVGSEATRVALSRGDRPPIFSALIPRATFEKLTADMGTRPRGTVSALFLDQPVSRFLNLISLVLPESKRIGLLSSPETVPLLSSLRHAAQGQGFRVENEEVEINSEPVAALNRLLARSDLLLALPDTRIYKRENTRAILLTTFRHQKPVIAFSAGDVGAGALAAVFSTPSQLGRQTSELVRALKSDNVTLPPPAYPIHYSLSVNRSVAQSLGLNPAEDAMLLKALTAADKENR